MSQISPLMFFSSEKELFSWTYLLKKTPRRTKILISPVWNKILKIWDTLFEFMQIEVKYVKNYFKIFLPQEAGAFGNNMVKESQKPRQRLKKYVYYIFTENICSAWSLIYCINVLNLLVLKLANLWSIRIRRAFRY